jgi:RNA polymerase sigma factor (sigma-70 family)
MDAAIENDPLQCYLGKKYTFTPLSKEQEITLGKQSVKGCKYARKQLVTSNLLLVVSIAKKYTFKNACLMDLIEEGNLGLLHAVDNFDPDKGVRFSTYATWWIRLRITNAFQENNCIIQVPRDIQRDVRHLQAAIEKSPAASIDMLSNMLSMSRRRINNLLHIPLYSESIDGAQNTQSDGFYETLSDPLLNQEMQHAVRETCQVVTHLLATLPYIKAYIIRHRYGLDDVDIMTLSELSDILNITSERVRQIEKETLTLLRKQATKENINWGALFTVN